MQAHVVVVVVADVVVVVDVSVPVVDVVRVVDVAVVVVVSVVVVVVEHVPHDSGHGCPPNSAPVPAHRKVLSWGRLTACSQLTDPSEKPNCSNHWATASLPLSVHVQVPHVFGQCF